MDTGAADVQTILAEWLLVQKVSLDVLRLDKVHHVVSGNKLFKLKYYLQEAKEQHKESIITFGGAWSNHIVATAYASKEAGFKSIGIIRGEKPPVLSDTLFKAMEFGMQLIYVSREVYKVLKRDPEDITKLTEFKQLGLSDLHKCYFIAEGGYGITGTKGAAEIGHTNNLSAYTHIIAAVGTGTMLAGLIRSALHTHKIIGISSMKGNLGLRDEVLQLLPTEIANHNNFDLIHEYHFGGFGKHPVQLTDFINEVYRDHHLPLDIVYTSKTFFAIKDLVGKGYFAEGSKLLMVHSGGLQGNSSLPLKVLAF